VVICLPKCYSANLTCLPRCDLFNKAFDHISGTIDNVYKALTKGKAAPQGGVAYLSLEDSDVSESPPLR
jgi:chromosome segregation ATPase